MAISEAYSGSATITTSWYSMTANQIGLVNNTASGFYQLLVDASNMAVGDTYEVKIQGSAVYQGGTLDLRTIRFHGAHSQPLIVIDPIMLISYWDFGIRKITGTDRTFTWSIRQTA
jgi:hypothetical protein